MTAHDERDLNLFYIKIVYMTLKNSACKSMCCCNECSFQILNFVGYKSLNYLFDEPNAR